jgi:hypothetical protein
MDATTRLASRGAKLHCSVIEHDDPMVGAGISFDGLLG